MGITVFSAALHSFIASLQKLSSKPLNPYPSMAFSLRSNLPFSSQPHHSTSTRPVTHTRTTLTVRCGPRNNCGPLHKGRTLSIEAIQAVQSLKRTHPTNLDDEAISKTLSRLVKADLVAAFNELLRQDHCHLALKVFSTIRSEEWYKINLNLYANLVAALARKGLSDHIDRLIFDLEAEDGDLFGGKGLTTLIKAMIAVDRGEATVRIYRMMKRSGWSCTSAVEDYLAKVLSRGLKRLGEVNVASEIDMELGRMSGAF